ncbi:hypothetical protein B0T20DRAFT_218437 [Sordaria brevicollis]|uniref:Uncharacterized protein n=1 Tax=Sordaria brevicollis TaxID=83679 RepID=A0AAE0PF60_SORBR|nr:hypothetical protein B0T20DRAFT_218437 [Sordaria brevicollis]
MASMRSETANGMLCRHGHGSLSKRKLGPSSTHPPGQRLDSGTQFGSFPGSLQTLFFSASMSRFETSTTHGRSTINDRRVIDCAFLSWQSPLYLSLVILFILGFSWCWLWVPTEMARQSRVSSWLCTSGRSYSHHLTTCLGISMTPPTPPPPRASRDPSWVSSHKPSTFLPNNAD